MIPPTAPIKADKIIALKIIGWVVLSRYDRRERGATFWIVIRIIA